MRLMRSMCAEASRTNVTTAPHAPQRADEITPPTANNGVAPSNEEKNDIGCHAAARRTPPRPV